MRIQDKNEEFLVFCGIDWATQTHQVCVLDHRRELIEQRSVPHDGDSLQALADWLIALAGGDLDALLPVSGGRYAGP